MAINIVRKKHKNADGTYDIVHYETQAKAVWMSDGRSVEETTAGKQDKLTGSTGQVIGFDSNGNPIAQEAPAGAEIYTATIGTSWTEDANTGIKIQTVSISGITAENTAKVSNYFNSANTADGYATFVEQENQFLDFITNGFAETVNGGIKFTIFGDTNTVSIPILVEVV